MKYAPQNLVFPATFHVISRKFDLLWDSVAVFCSPSPWDTMTVEGGPPNMDAETTIIIQ